jgi:preprotein translocase subunit SecD
LLPLQDGERLVVNNHRYSKGDAPRFVVVGATPDVALDLAGKPEAIKEGEEVVGILLSLRPKAAAALEKLTGDRSVRQVAVVIGSEVVTMHKVREAIKGGEVKITSCAPRAAAHLLEQLLAREEAKR